MSSDDPPAKDEALDKARRKLLRALVYAAPAVISTVVVKPAHAQQESCGPAACTPNGACGPCGPDFCPPKNPGEPCMPDNCKPRT